MIRSAGMQDLESITAIYNQAIDARYRTGYTARLIPAEHTAWLQGHIGTPYPLYVYEQANAVAGWISISPYREGRAALKHTVEISYFIHNACQRHGIGAQLLQHALEQCRALGYKTAIAIILDRNEGSIALVKKAGFAQWGYLPGVAEFDGVPCGQYYFGRHV